MSGLEDSVSACCLPPLAVAPVAADDDGDVLVERHMVEMFADVVLSMMLLLSSSIGWLWLDESSLPFVFQK